MASIGTRRNRQKNYTKRKNGRERDRKRELLRKREQIRTMSLILINSIFNYIYISKPFFHYCAYLASLYTSLRNSSSDKCDEKIYEDEDICWSNIPRKLLHISTPRRERGGDR